MIEALNWSKYWEIIDWKKIQLIDNEIKKKYRLQNSWLNFIQ